MNRFTLRRNRQTPGMQISKYIKRLQPTQNKNTLAFEYVLDTKSPGT